LSQITPRGRKGLPNTINEDSVDDHSYLQKPLVQTQFIDWSCKYFAQPMMNEMNGVDVESPHHYQREWRYLRNSEIRQETLDELRRITHSRVENQLFSTRCNSQPTSIQFHPYDPHIAIAYRDSFVVWDYLSHTKVCTVRGEKSSSRGGGRITSLEYVNAHDVSLIAAASEDGSVRVWKQCGTLLTAWQALTPVSQSGAKAPPSNNYGGSCAGVVMSWDQRRQSFIVGGEARFLRIWDAEKELKVYDIPTGADACVTSVALDSNGGPLFCIGCGDGTVRLFDHRLPAQEARIMTYREHSAWVVNVSLSGDNSYSLLSGSTAGDVRLFDTRKPLSTLVCQESSGMKAMAAHTVSNIFACGFINQISVYKNNGSNLNVIKSIYHEWFYAPRFGPVGCLAFHPYKVILAAGSVDSTLTIFSVDPKR